jgi:hypothetical protein
VIAEGRKIARDRQRGRPRTDQRNALAVLVLRYCRQPVADVFLVIGGDALQAADGDRFLFHADATARGLARTIAGSTQNARKDIRFPVDHVGVTIATIGDHPDIFGNGGMGRTGPLAINNLMEVIR